MRDVIVIRRCATAEEAVVVASLLQDAGFQASLYDWNFSTVYWGVNSALGGVGIAVPAKQALGAGRYMMEAVETADERLSGEFGEYDRSKLPRDRLRALSMLFIYLGGMLLFTPLLVWFLSSLPESWFAPKNGSMYATYDDRFNQPIAQSGRVIDHGANLAEAADGLLLLVAIVILLANEIFNARQSLRQREMEKADSDEA